MSTSALTLQQRREQALGRLADVLELTKPRIAGLVLVTVAVAWFLAAPYSPQWTVLVHTLVGTALVAASASALNQWLERRTDALMPRTAGRPLPAGRLGAVQVVALGVVSVVAGLLYLGLVVGPVTAALGFGTWFLYVCVYTPLKTRTASNTAVGAVAGALPVLMGWSAAASLDLRAAALAMIVYLWQFPHFMAIAWIYRDEYRAAGLKMLPVVDPGGRWAGAQAVVGALMLLPVSLMPVAPPPASTFFVVAAMALGAGQAACAASFCRRLDRRSARRLLWASLVYLPALLLLLLLEPLA